MVILGYFSDFYLNYEIVDFKLFYGWFLSRRRTCLLSTLNEICL